MLRNFQSRDSLLKFHGQSDSTGAASYQPLNCAVNRIFFFLFLENETIYILFTYLPRNNMLPLFRDTLTFVHARTV